MAGTIPYSLSQQFDALGNVLSGGKLYIIQSGTVSTPQNAYSDSGLTLALPNPIIMDSAGRLPQFFLADGSIKIRMLDRNGVEQVTADSILVVGASTGGGAITPVDATTIFATGDLKCRYGTGILSGFVRANGRTIGSATSGAAERANSDAQTLFEYLWNNDANLSVSTGRGASSTIDWTANKTIALPDWRGRALAALDDMGNSAAGRLTATYFGTAATVLGAAGGAENHTLTTAEIPAHTHANSLTDPGHVHAYGAAVDAPGGSTINSARSGSAVNTQSATTGITITNASAGGGGAHAIAQPTMLATIYIKL